MDEAELRTKLAELREEERAVSAQRVKLHERLASFANAVAEERERFARDLLSGSASLVSKPLGGAAESASVEATTEPT